MSPAGGFRRTSTFPHRRNAAVLPADRRAISPPSWVQRPAITQAGSACSDKPDATPVAVSVAQRDVTNLDDRLRMGTFPQTHQVAGRLARLAHSGQKPLRHRQVGWTPRRTCARPPCTVAQSVICLPIRNIDSDRIANWQLLATIDGFDQQPPDACQLSLRRFRAHTLTREATPMTGDQLNANVDQYPSVAAAMKHHRRSSPIRFVVTGSTPVEQPLRVLGLAANPGDAQDNAG